MKNKQTLTGDKRGILKADFALFHLKDQRNQHFEFHYHDFNKVIIFISGRVTYLIEGKAFKLKPWDILLVNSSEIHKPLIDPSEVYERIVIWVNHSFLTKQDTSECSLLTCFEEAAEKKLNLLRPHPENLQNIKQVLNRLENAYAGSEFGSVILKDALFLEFIVYLNRLFLGAGNSSAQMEIEFDEEIGAVLDYINTHLNDDLSINNLSQVFFVNKYHLMHKFKVFTGYTVHSYILQKRLMAAGILIRKGKPAGEACAQCGFRDYSNFSRSFKKMFGLSPKKYFKSSLTVPGLGCKLSL